MSGNDIAGIDAFDNVVDRLLDLTTMAERDRAHHANLQAELANEQAKHEAARREIGTLTSRIGAMSRQKSYDALLKLRDKLRQHGQWSPDSTLFMALVNNDGGLIKMVNDALDADDEIPF